MNAETLMLIEMVIRIAVKTGVEVSDIISNAQISGEDKEILISRVEKAQQELR
ncbi:MAG: hypothetical protein A4E64_02141 [Syntrophorhabdus sp. PtaU1.Bin058]|nr:MAG: hypothetical protein A4E64_02141 [Syntrophorhabdus sp. PtaU1.Bin058]